MTDTVDPRTVAAEAAWSEVERKYHPEPTAQPKARAKKAKPPEPPDPRLSPVGAIVDRFQKTTTELIKEMGHTGFTKGMRRAKDPERAMRIDSHQCKACWYSHRGQVWTFDRGNGCAWCGAEVER